MESIDKADCIVHGHTWRSPFHCLLNRLRKVYTIHNKYIQLWPQLLCLCDSGKQRYKSTWKTISNDDLMDQVFSLLEKSPKQSNTRSKTQSDNSGSTSNTTGPVDIKEVQPFLKLLDLESRQYSDISELGLKQVCVVRLVYLISQASKQDFTLEESSIYQAATAPEKITVAKEINFPVTISGEKSQLMVNFLIGKQGSRIKLFASSKKCNKVTLGRVNPETSSFDVCIKTKKTVVAGSTLATEDGQTDHMATLKEDFINFTKTQLEIYQAVSDYIKGKGKRISWIQGRAYSYPRSDKLVRQQDFHCKIAKHRKDREKSTRPQKNVLDHGHCLQCRKPFTDLKQSEPCIYHPGYIVTKGSERHWSCCEKATEEHMQTHADHADTGCCSSKTHAWRVNKKQDKRQISLNRRRNKKDIPPIQGHFVYDNL